MAAAAAAMPISIPTELGAREVLDVGGAVLSLQKIENPQASLHQCAARYGPQTICSIFEKLEQQDEVAPFEELNLSDNRIGDDGAQWLLSGLTARTTAGEPVGKNLKVLLMPRARMGTAGMKAMGQLIGASTSLENVVLSSNICDAEGVQGEFCTGLAANTSVKSLCLAACRLGDMGVLGLTDGPLKDHPSLEHLSLQYNRLKVPSAKSLAGMLATNKTLKFLDLSGNSIGPEGATALVEGLKKNNGTLERLSVSQNEIKFEGARAFCKHFLSPKGRSLVYLDLRHNLIPYKNIVQLREELGRPMSGRNDGWMMLFGEDESRQLLLNR